MAANDSGMEALKQPKPFKAAAMGMMSRILPEPSRDLGHEQQLPVYLGQSCLSASGRMVSQAQKNLALIGRQVSRGNLPCGMNRFRRGHIHRRAVRSTYDGHTGRCKYAKLFFPYSVTRIALRQIVSKFPSDPFDTHDVTRSLRVNKTARHFAAGLPARTRAWTRLSATTLAVTRG